MTQLLFRVDINNFIDDMNFFSLHAADLFGLLLKNVKSLR